jgi:hypothetical protein
MNAKQECYDAWPFVKEIARRVSKDEREKRRQRLLMELDAIKLANIRDVTIN